MKFGQQTNLTNIFNAFFDQRDSLIRLKVMDLDNSNYIKINVKKYFFRHSQKRRLISFPSFSPLSKFHSIQFSISEVRVFTIFPIQINRQIDKQSDCNRPVSKEINLKFKGGRKLKFAGGRSILQLCYWSKTNKNRNFKFHNLNIHHTEMLLEAFYLISFSIANAIRYKSLIAISDLYLLLTCMAHLRSLSQLILMQGKDFKQCNRSKNQF